MTIKEKAQMILSTQEILPLECLNDPDRLEAENLFIRHQAESYLTFLYIGPGTKLMPVEPLGFETPLPIGNLSDICFKKTKEGWLRVQKDEIQ